MGRLTQYDREQIEYYFRLGFSIREIARKIGRDHSVVVRELKRNRSPHFAYEATKATYFSARRATKTNKRKLLKSEVLREWVVTKLKDSWSPEQIAGRLKNQPPDELKGKTLSHEAIYQYIYEEEPYLYHKLRRAHPDRWKRYARKPRKKITIPAKVSIHERPVAIDERIELGHFESDSMLCKGRKVGLSVQYERAIQLVRIHQIQGFSATETKEALKQTLESLPDNLPKSITFDNGTEGAKHHEIANEYQLQTYFCDTYAAWQKGGVENMNGLLRQYLPRKLELQTVTREQLYDIQERLNNRPRKKLNYQTPNEKLTEYKKSGALNS
jgi:IS30 family transposase